ncbi:MAG: polysaccharide deacetylase family protein [Gammaproteobacteria bacterium]
MSRRLIKAAISTAAHGLGFDRLVTRWRDSSQPLVLGYHRVVNDVADHDEVGIGTIPAMLVSTRTLERQIDWLSRRYEFGTLDEAAWQATSPSRRAKPLATITFDDGYEDVYRNAFPLLQRKGIPFAVFIVTSLVGTRSYQLHDRLYRLMQLRGERDALAATRALLTTRSRRQLLRAAAELERTTPIPDDAPPPLRAMTWPMVRTLHAAGVTIGSHTRNHPFLTNEPRHTLSAELKASRAVLERELNAPVKHFAYPNGDFDATVARAVDDAGYAYAYTTCQCRGTAPPALCIPRRLLWERSGAGPAGGFFAPAFACETAGVFDFASGCRRDHSA